MTRKNFGSATYRILEIFLNHVERHPLCLESLSLLFKWLHYSPEALSGCKERLIGSFILIFEKRVREIIKKFPDQGKKDEMALLFKRSLIEKSTFEDNLESYFRKMYPRAGSGQSVENLDKFDDEIPINKDLLIYRLSNENSFLEGLPQSQPNKNNQLPASNSKLVVPLLNLPIGNHRDSNPTIISRSTRRHEMLNKSSVSTSNRIQSQWPGDLQTNLSREPSLRDRRVSGTGGNDANMSYLEDVPQVHLTHQLSMPMVIRIDAAVPIRKRNPDSPGKKDGRVFFVSRFGMPSGKQEEKSIRRGCEIHWHERRPARHTEYNDGFEIQKGQRHRNQRFQVDGSMLTLQRNLRGIT